MSEQKERINPMILTDGETGDQYVLDFSRESVAYAERLKFDVDDLLKFPNTEIPKLFYFAFRKNHRFVPREKTDKILAEMDGLNDKELTKLVSLFQQAQLSNVIRTDGDDEDGESKKNKRFQVEL